MSESDELYYCEKCSAARMHNMSGSGTRGVCGECGTEFRGDYAYWRKKERWLVLDTDWLGQVFKFRAENLVPPQVFGGGE